jgi:hypothetical protein
VFEGFRLDSLGVSTVTTEQWVLTFAVMFIVLIGSIKMFTRVQRTFMDTV